MGKMTLRQIRFVDAYILHGNATRAAREAGYSAKTADTIGPRLLGNVGVQKRIQEAEAARRDRIQLTEDYELKRLQEIAEGNLYDLIEIGADGCPVLKKDLTRDDLACVESLTAVETNSGRLIPRIKLKNSHAAIVTIATIRGKMDGSSGDEAPKELEEANRALDEERERNVAATGGAKAKPASNGNDNGDDL